MSMPNIFTAVAPLTALTNPIGDLPVELATHHRLKAVDPLTTPTATVHQGCATTFIAANELPAAHDRVASAKQTQ